MISDLQIHFEKALVEYTSDKYMDSVLFAKKEYLSRTGQINEDDFDYESRMNSFYDWYLMNFLPQNFRSTIMVDYLEKNQVPVDISNAFKKAQFSLYEVKSCSPDRTLLWDIIHGRKIELLGEARFTGCIKSDIFVGRVLQYDKRYCLLPGVSTLPPKAHNMLIKKAKKMGEFKDPNVEIKFLLDLELKKTKYRHYSHLDPNTIFR